MKIIALLLLSALTFFNPTISDNSTISYKQEIIKIGGDDFFILVTSNDGRMVEEVFLIQGDNGSTVPDRVPLLM